jgi:tetraacyldisaccharide 4'-kinase
MRAGAPPRAHRLVQAWGRRGPLARLLWPISLLFGALVALRLGLFRLGLFKVHRVTVPVIVVGNVVAGGAGKTPVVMALVQHWQARGLRVGVVSREVHADSPASEAGDEAVLVKRVTSAAVFVARKRFEAASALLARYPQTDLIVCDDGLQHHALYRDLEVCVFDDRGTGNGWLLPAGPLREPWPRKSQVREPGKTPLARTALVEAAPASLVLHSGEQPAFEGFTAHRQLADYAVRADGTRLALSTLTRMDPPPLLALAAIAQPEAFFAMLRARGLTLKRTLALPDHYGFDDWIPPSVRDYTLICTEKDAVKLWRQAPEALAVPLQVRLEPAFLEAIERLLRPLLGAKLSSAHEHSHGHTTS